MDDAGSGERTIETWRVRVAGRVQNVGLREACVRQARAQGLAGWVRNRIDGTVEALVQGTPQQIEDFRLWLRHGVPAPARVDAVDAERQAPQPAPFHGFERAPTE